jgi:hypothetical protein
MIVFDSDDFGVNQIISDQCQSHDCRDALLAFKDSNPKFKATLFAIPHNMSKELLEWSKANKDWIELAVHGITHSSNYECEKMSYEEFDALMSEPSTKETLDKYFVKGFKAPGWQISDDIYRWLVDHKWWVADQSYNDERRPKELPAYEVGENSLHTHVWDCVGNGVYELFDQILERVKDEQDFLFVSEAIRG